MVFSFSEHVRGESAPEKRTTLPTMDTERNMAAPERSKEPADSNIPDYELVGVNSKVFNVASFRDEWLSRLEPRDYCFNQVDEDEFDANFMKETGVSADTMKDLKSVCR